MYSIKLLLCISIMGYCSSESILSTLLDTVLLHKNIKCVTYLYDTKVNIPSFARKGCLMVNFRKFSNTHNSINQYCLPKHAFVVLFDSVQETVLKRLSLSESAVIIATTNFNPSLVRRWKLSNLRWNSDIIIISGKEKMLDINSYEIWKLHGFGLNNQYGNLTLIGSLLKFIQKKQQSNFYNDRKKLYGIELKIPSTMCNSRKIRTSQEEYAFLRIEREINCILLNLIQCIHNFSIGITPTIHFAGKDKELDIMSGFMEESLVDVTDAIAQTYPFRKTFILKNPVSGDKNIFIKPFSRKVWYMCILLIFTVIVLLKILLSILYAFEKIDDESWSLVVLTLLSTFCLEGSPADINFLSFRTLVYTCLLSSTMLYNYYSSSIVSSLLTSPAPSVKSIRDLQKADIKLRMEGIPNYYKPVDDILTTNDLTITLNISEAIGGIKKGDFAYYTEPATRYKLLEKHLSFLEACRLIEIDVVPIAFVTVMARKKMEFKELLKISYRIIIERGFLKRELRRLLKQRPVCLAHVDFEALTLHDLSAAFILYSVGVILSMIVFFLEHVHSRLINLYRKKRQ